jgi:hypothetical protein
MRRGWQGGIFAANSSIGLGMKREFTIAVTGHRPNRLPAPARGMVEDQIGTLLTEILLLADAQARAIVLVCGLAEGADRMAADAALRQGVPFAAVLPFAVAEYQKDFADEESRSHFQSLLAAARRVDVLPGDANDRDSAYEAAGLTMLNVAQMLIAIWDGGPSGGRGGTTEMVRHAAQRGMPVLVIDALGQKPPEMLSGDGSVTNAVSRVLAQTSAR